LQEAESKKYTKGLKADERRFVEAYNGSPVMAARAAGVTGNYVTVKPLAIAYRYSPRIVKALERKAAMRIPGLKIFIGGDFEGDGKRRKLKPIGESGQVLEFDDYISDIHARLESRMSIILTEAIKINDARPHYFYNVFSNLRDGLNALATDKRPKK
jgi:hypothetical protein